MIDQLTGVSLPLSTWESQVLPARLPDYSPATLDGLFAAGELSWTGHGRLGSDDGWVRLHLAGALPLGVDAEEVERAADSLESGSVPARVLDLLRSSPGALRHGEILKALADQSEAVPPTAVTEALWDLAYSTLITNDSFAALRTHALGPAPRSGARRAGRSRPASRRGAARLSAAMMRTGTSSPSELAEVTGPASTGRWSAVRVAPVDASARAAAIATLLLDRHGVVTRGAMDVEAIPGSFAAVYRVLSALEENGSCRRGYFVDGLGASQFAPSEAVDLLRDRDREREARSRGNASGQHPGSGELGGPAGRLGHGGAADPSSFTVLAATDPANPYGAALPWPALPIEPPDGVTVRPARRAGAIVVLHDGAVAAFVDKGGKHLLWWAGEQETPEVAAQVVRAIAEDAVLASLAIERVSGRPISAEQSIPVVEALVAAGCYRSPRSVRLRAGGR